MRGMASEQWVRPVWIIKKVKMPDTPTRIAVVGGGIAGLAAAHRFVELKPNWQIALFEREKRLGGVLCTVHEKGYQIEQSADNFITTVPYGLDLCRRLGIADELVQTNPKFRQTFVVHRGRLAKLPDGFLMMAPTRLWPLALTPILSPWGKLRAALEYFIPPRRGDGDESMAGFVRRRLGKEAFDRLVEPLVSAVYAADLEKLSVEATLARFRDMERQYGSLVRAMRREMAARRRQQKNKNSCGKNRAGESGARYSMFVTLRDGLTRLVDVLAERLPQDAARLNSTVATIEQSPNGGWTITYDGPLGKQAETFDAVVLATPSHVSAQLLRPIDVQLADELAKIEHSGTAIVSLAFDRRQVGHPLDGMGAVVPAVENSPILACSFSSQKYTHRSPGEDVVLRVFVGGARAPQMAEMPDELLLPIVLDELTKLLKIKGEPKYTLIAHWPRTMPQYHVGHKDLVASIESRVDRLPGLELAGNAYHGVGIPDCIHTGETAAGAGD